MLLRMCSADRCRFVLSANSFAEFKEKVKTKLAVDQFTVVLEDDGSSVDDDVMTAIIEGETLGTLMVLKESEIWTRVYTGNSELDKPLPVQPVQDSSEPQPSTSSGSSGTYNQLYPIDEILQRYNKGTICGPALIEKLSAGMLMTRPERIFFVKVLGKYLMKVAFTVDKPTKLEKTRMAQSIVARFPILKADGIVGHEHFYDPVSRTGFLESYIRQRRSRCQDIMTPKAPRMSRTVNTEPEHETDDSEAKLRERRPTVSNKDELLALMEATRKERRNWITRKSPTITQILQRYPRLADMPDAVAEEFVGIFPGCDVQLRDVWPRANILQKAQELAIDDGDVQSMLSGLQDQWNEEYKTLASFRVLPFLLPSPPRRGARTPRLSPLCCSHKLYTEIVDADNIEDAVKRITGTQPLLFKFQEQLWVKLDNSATQVSASCIADAFQLLLQYFFVMNLSYPPELWLVYGFLERVMGVKPTVGRSVRLTEFCQHVLQSPN